MRLHTQRYCTKRQSDKHLWHTHTQTRHYESEYTVVVHSTMFSSCRSTTSANADTLVLNPKATRMTSTAMEYNTRPTHKHWSWGGGYNDVNATKTQVHIDTWMSRCLCDGNVAQQVFQQTRKMHTGTQCRSPVIDCDQIWSIVIKYDLWKDLVVIKIGADCDQIGSDCVDDLSAEINKSSVPPKRIAQWRTSYQG